MRAAFCSTLLAGLVGLGFGGYNYLAAAPGDDPPAPSPSSGAKPGPSNPGGRFDKLVREDLFAGFGGDEAAMLRGLAKCDGALAADPRHAEALVWRGAVRVFQSSQLFAKKSFIGGLSLWNQGIRDMDDAVALAPHNPGVRIPRAAVLLPAARNAPAAMGKPLLGRILDDYRTIETLQQNHLDKLGTHPLGELRMGLADVYRLMGDLPKSREQLELVRKQLPETEYAGRAATWLAAEPTAKLAHDCIGCHGQ